MDSELWGRVDQLLERALDLPSEERTSFVRQASASDDLVRHEVLELLAVDAQVTDFLEHPVLPAPEDRPPDPPGTTFGPYRMLQILGHGGMGTVYLAQREDELRRRVAVKVLRADLASPELAERLEVERQVLARLEHPGIARLYDGGSTEDGRPYLVMELIEGVPIDVYCARHDLDLEARIQLFRQACEAVSYAHRNLLVHRDLKPGNILVTADGSPKLLDFGIAKLLDGGLFDLPGHATRTGLHPMTPQYASPEQIRGEPVTTASDVYSLGALLHRLLTGASPYRLDTNDPLALERAILEVPPQAPSEMAPAELCRRLRGDLDVIVLKALRKQPERRYGSVQELSQDLERHLQHQPVKARPETLGYRVGKLLRRRALAVTVTALGIALVVGFALVTWMQSRQLADERDVARSERARAEQERTRAEQNVQLLLDLLGGVDPREAQGEDLTVREILDRAAARLGELAEQPEVYATALITVGRLYHALDLYDEAEPLLEEALERLRELHPDPHVYLAEALAELGRLRLSQGSDADAAALFREAVDIERQPSKTSDATHLRLAELLNDLGFALYNQRDYPEAKTCYREALEQARKTPAAPAILLARIHNHLGLVFHDEGDIERATDHYRDGLELVERAGAEALPEKAELLNDLAILVFEAREGPEDLKRAEDLHRESLALREKLYGERHSAVAMSLSNLGNVVLALDRPDEAREIYERSLDIWHHIVPPRSVPTLRRHAKLARQQGDFDFAEDRLRKALELQREALQGTTPAQAAEKHVMMANTMDELGQVLEDQGRWGEAELLYRRSLGIDRQALGPEHPWVARSEVSLARVLVRRNRLEEADGLLREALPGLHEFLAGQESERQKAFWSPVVTEGEELLASIGPSESG